MSDPSDRRRMWAHDESLAHSLELFAKSVFDALELDVEPEVLVVGFPLAPGAAIALASNGATAPLSTFQNLREVAQAELETSRRSRMRYSHPAIAEEIAYRERQAALGRAVTRLATGAESSGETTTFATPAFRIGDHEVVCALRMPASLFDAFPAIQVDWEEGSVNVSFLTTCVNEVLAEALRRMRQPEPGRLNNDALTPTEALRRAARAFLQSPFVSQTIDRIGLFEALDALSLTEYERSSSTGRMLLTSAPETLSGDVLWFEDQTPLRNARWARKMLQTATDGYALIATERNVVGLVRTDEAMNASSYFIDFLGYHRWELRRGDQVLMRASSGLPQLPLEALQRDRLKDNLRRLFPGAAEADLGGIAALLDALSLRSGGSTLVIAGDAADEAIRLQDQATRVQPRKLNEALLLRAAAMDGAILLSPDGLCHAIGVVLDGVAAPRRGSERGARYNSAVRYVHAAPSRMAVVVSADGALDVLPLLRPRVSRAMVEAELCAFESAVDDDYHQPLAVLEKHRFYLDADQCRRANAAANRFNALPPGEAIRFIIAPFALSPDMTEEHLI